MLVVGLIGAIIARFAPRGMSWALFAMALAQAVVPVIAFFIWRPDFDLGVVQIFALNAGFVLLFAVSGLLFRRASAAGAK